MPRSSLFWKWKVEMTDLKNLKVVEISKLRELSNCQSLSI